MSVWRHGLPRARQRRRLALVLATACAMAACQPVDRQPASETVFFPQPPPHEGPTIRLLAVGSGTLALEDDCLWLKSGADRHLIIWPPSYRLVAKGGRLTVLDGTGAKVADVGASIAIGGGELTNDGSARDINILVEAKIGRAIPAACRLGRYWDAAGGPADAS